jgi:hypothetical protein
VSSSEDWQEEIVVETPYGLLPVPRPLLETWNTHGWPDEETLRRMIKAGSVYTQEDGSPS